MDKNIKFGFWNYAPLGILNNKDAVQDWVECGINLPMSFTYDHLINKKEEMLELLDECFKHDLKLIISDTRTLFTNLRKISLEQFKKDVKAAMGDFASHPALKAADYKLAVHLENGRGVYTFCMCPGGEVINASSEQGGIAVNGMSNSRRDGVNANSALLVGINPEDLSGDSVLAGCEFQREIEQRAYKIGGGRVPVSSVGKFVFKENIIDSKVNTTVKPNTIDADFDEIFPKFVTDSIRSGIKEMDKKINGFASPYAMLTAPETRSSSPVRILRNENGESITFGGIYPCGEGAGYAGGIMSAAVDGMKSAEQLISAIKSRQ
jgi:uncharacterized FAD-dependent dehydrogenase